LVVDVQPESAALGSSGEDPERVADCTSDAPSGYDPAYRTPPSLRHPPMHRRDLLRSAAATAALAVLPRSAFAADILWQRVAERGPVSPHSTEAALVRALADTIIPRTDTVGALDVNVPAFIDVIVNEHYTVQDRDAFNAGLKAIDALAVRVGGDAFAALNAERRGLVMNALEQLGSRNDPAARTYARLKGLVVHGYFTSEAVQQQVLSVDVIPGTFSGDAPLRSRSRSGDSND